MPLYHIVFLLLLFGVIIEYWQKKTPKWLFFLSFMAMGAMLCLRFGQGSDYTAYRLIYYTMPTSINGMMAYGYAKAEIGWRIITMLFRRAGLPFDVFVFLHSLLEMYLLWRFLKRYCKNKMLALFVGYHTLYLTYMVSAMRQGLVILVFLGVLLPLLLEGKWIRYFLGVVLLMGIHSVALILFVPLVIMAIRLSVEKIIAFVAVGFSLGIILAIFDVGHLVTAIGMSYAGESNVSMIALVERLASFVMVSYIYYLYTDGVAPSENDPYFKLFKLYSFGILIYGLLMWSPLISSRTIYMLKALEIPLIATCIDKCRKGKSLVILYCVLLCSVLYIKNIGSCISQMQYIDTSVWNYPYYSIWDKEAAIAGRETTSRYYEWLYRTKP